MSIVLVRAVIIYIFTIAAVRIMGKRQLGELSTHEFVITILISSVATIPLEDNAIPLTNSLLPILIFISLEIIESALSLKSSKFRTAFLGKPIFVIKDGRLIQKELSRLRITLSDLLDNLRQQGVFDISTIENAIVETNGKLSVQLKADSSPLTAKALKLDVQKAKLPIAVVTDSNTISDYFGNVNLKESEIELLIKASGKDKADILLLTVDGDGGVYIIERDKKE